MQPHALILADGTALTPAMRNKLRRGRFVIVLDGAAEAVRKQGWLPDLIAGDFDSVSRATLRHFEKKGVRLLHTPDQSYTDLEKALAWCVLRDFGSIWVAQALGSRLDHSFQSLALLRRFHSGHHELRLFQDGERVLFARDEKLRLRGKRGRRLAVLPFPACRVKSKGLAYEMRDLALELGTRESVSNSVRGAEALLTIEGDAIVVEEV